jgi:hypothetical protein
MRRPERRVAGHLMSKRCCEFTSCSNGDLSDVAMKEALYDTPLYREFAGLRRIA